MQDLIYYFSYGADLNPKLMQRRCPNAKLIGSGILKGFRLVFSGLQEYAEANIREHPESYVRGLLWQTDKKGERRLDHHNSYPLTRGKIYAKIQSQGIYYPIMTYQYDHSQYLGYPSEKYLDMMLTAYLDQGWDTSPIREALAESSRFPLKEDTPSQDTLRVRDSLTALELNLCESDEEFRAKLDTYFKGTTSKDS